MRCCRGVRRLLPAWQLSDAESLAAQQHACVRGVHAVQVIVCCGYWDNSIRCYSSEEGRLLQSVRVHKDIVTCVELGSDGRTLASGARAIPHLLGPLRRCCSTGALRASVRLSATCFSKQEKVLRALPCLPAAALMTGHRQRAPASGLRPPADLRSWGSGFPDAACSVPSMSAEVLADCGAGDWVALTDDPTS